jgi:hypothetical protein
MRNRVIYKAIQNRTKYTIQNHKVFGDFESSESINRFLRMLASSCKEVIPVYIDDYSLQNCYRSYLKPDHTNRADAYKQARECQLRIELAKMKTNSTAYKFIPSLYNM